MTPSPDVSDLIDDLLYEPPRDVVELEHRLGEVPPEQVRAVLVERIEEGRLDGVDALVVGRIFEAIGLGEEYDRLVEIVSEGIGRPGAEVWPSEVAFIVLATNREVEKDEPLETFGCSRERYVETAARVYSAIFEFTAVHVDVVRDFGEMLLGEPDDLRAEIFEELERHRTETEFQAGLTYRPLLEETRYEPLWAQSLEAIVEEGVVGDADWIERRGDELDDERWREQFHEAADRLRGRADESPAAPEGFALLGTPDGAGNLALLLFTERPDGEAYDGFHFAFRHDRPAIGEGYALRDAVREEIDQLAEDLARERAIRTTEVSIDLGIEIARRLIDRADPSSGEMLPETELGIYLLDRLPRSGVEIPEVAPASEIDERAVRSTFEDDECFESWFFDRGLLEAASVPPVPPPGEPADAWREQAAGAIAGLEGVSERIAGNFDWMALWYQLDGDAATAGQLAAVAESARTDFAASLALELVLEHTVEAMRQMQEYASSFLVDLLGDPALRGELRERHLTGGDGGGDDDERLLDYMETAYRTLEEIGPELPERLRPSDEQMLEVAGPLGRVGNRMFEGDQQETPDALAQAVSDELLEAGIDLRVAGLLTSELLTNDRLLSMLER